MTRETADFACSKCGATGFSLFYYEPTPSEMRKHQMCFECNFWRDRVGVPRAIIIEGSFYSDGGRKADRHEFLGFGGREFSIEMLDGRTISTNNLWHGGRIPEVWRSAFPDNAKWGTVETRRISHGQGYYGSPKRP